MKKLLSIVVLFLGLSLIYGPAFAQDTVVVPNNNVDMNANGSFKLPFNCQGQPPTGIRWQQIYIGSEVGRAGLIDKVSFRLNGVDEGRLGDNGFDAVYPNVIIQLSTTDKVPFEAEGDPISTTFADNIGADVKTVYSGNLRLSPPNCFVEFPPQPGEVCPFDVMIPLQEMFHYDPANGNLLLDMRIPQCPELGEFIPAFDLETFTVGNTGELISYAWAPDVDSPTSPLFQASGLVTQFRFFVPRNVPTLSEWGLIATAGILGLAGLIVIRRRAAV